MNKTPYFLAASVALMATAPAAYAESQMYGKLGANMSSSTSLNVSSNSGKYDAKSGVMPELTLGYNLGDGFAVELMYQKAGGSLTNVTTGTTNNKATGGDLIFTSTMIKGIYNIQTDTTAMYNPYIGLGLGKTNIKGDKVAYVTNTTPNSFDGSATSMQLTFGNRFKFDQGWFGDVAANYTNINAATVTDTDGFTEKFDSTKVTSIGFAVGKSF